MFQRLFPEEDEQIYITTILCRIQPDLWPYFRAPMPQDIEELVERAKGKAKEIMPSSKCELPEYGGTAPRGTSTMTAPSIKNRKQPGKQQEQDQAQLHRNQIQPSLVH
ncbi:hypothetical protein PR048_006084 [Dryococelus australis]|uniref:Uncharacterized protein n=1 Tax=Dryococelus australis TaxID=614101 RepID=A0ABQ9IA09_9NEOP|nr:hypothetical protein PR048_006084 [Dryococelus australis]